MSENNQYPSLIQQGKNLAKFSLELINYLRNNDNDENTSLMVSDDVYKKRLEICKNCDKFDKSQDRCRECGCFVSVKAKFVLDSCPLNKWIFNDSEWEEIFTNIINDMEEKNEK